MDQEKSLSSYFSDSLISEEGASSSMANGGSGVIGGGDSHQNSNENGGDGSNNPIWKRPIVEVGDVMAGESWPALSESVHLKSKSSSTNSLKALLNIPPSVSQGSSSTSPSSKHVGLQKFINLGGGGVSSSGHGGKRANGSLSQAPPTKGVVVEASNPGKSRSSVGESSRVNMRKDVGHSATSYGANGVLSQVPLKQVLVDEASPSNSVNSVASVGQSSRENAHRDVRNQGGSYAGNGILSQAPPALGVVVEASSSNIGKNVAFVGESSRANAYNNSGPRGGSYLGNGQQNQQRPPYRRSNSGPLIRGDGSYNHSYGNKSNQERRNLNWNQNRSFNNRGNHGFQHKDGSRPVFQGLSPNVPFIPQAPIPGQHFMNPYMYTGMPPSLFVMPGYHPGHLFAPIIPYSPMFVPMPDSKLPSETVRPDPKLPSEVGLPSTSSPNPELSDPELLSKIIRQINHYFSEENLVKDWYLKRYMDNEGWVPVTLIAGFNRVRRLTDNVQLILDALHASDVVEIQGDKVRRRNDWVRWLQQPFQNPTAENNPSVNNSWQDSLGADLGNLSLDGRPSI